MVVWGGVSRPRRSAADNRPSIRPVSIHPPQPCRRQRRGPQPQNGPHLQPPTRGSIPTWPGPVAATQEYVCFFFFWFIPRPAFQDHLLVQSSASCQVASAFESGGTRGHMVASWAVSAAAVIDRGSRIPIWRASSQDAGVVVCVTRWQSPGYHPHLFPWPMMSIGRVDKTAAEAACGCWGNDKKGSAEADPCEEPPHKNAGCFLIAPCGV